jgi:hypothetical protein
VCTPSVSASQSTKRPAPSAPSCPDPSPHSWYNRPTRSPSPTPAKPPAPSLSAQVERLAAERRRRTDEASASLDGLLRDFREWSGGERVDRAAFAAALVGLGGVRVWGGSVVSGLVLRCPCHRRVAECTNGAQPQDIWPKPSNDKCLCRDQKSAAQLWVRRAELLAVAGGLS